MYRLTPRKPNFLIGITVGLFFQIRDSSCNYEAFMNILKLTDKPAELEAVKDKVLEELQYLRSLDTAGDGTPFQNKSTDRFQLNYPSDYMSSLFLCRLDINVIKNQINSLLFVKKVCETRIQRLQSGKVRQVLHWRIWINRHSE